MSPSQSVAASLPPDARQKMAIEMLAKSKPVSYLAVEHQVSRKFLYEQSQKAKTALEETFEPKASDEVLFHLPVTKTWLFQLILALVLICHCSYRGVVELFRDLFDVSISVGTIHNCLQSAAARVVLQKLVEDRKLPRKRVSYAATPKIWLMNFTRSVTAPFLTFLICPFRSMLIIS